eukprot:1191210-Prorocentrum_minimum.AAC.1
MWTLRGTCGRYGARCGYDSDDAKGLDSLPDVDDGDDDLWILRANGVDVRGRTWRLTGWTLGGAPGVEDGDDTLKGGVQHGDPWPGVGAVDHAHGY